MRCMQLCSQIATTFTILNCKNMEINVAVSVPVITQINIAILIPPPALLGNLNIFIF